MPAYVLIAVLLPLDKMGRGSICDSCSDPHMRLRSCMRLISKMPTLAAIAYKTAKGKTAAATLLLQKTCMPAVLGIPVCPSLLS